MGTVAYAVTEKGIQYGTIALNDGEYVKFWFLSHHLTNDMGGTIYEFPGGERHFYAGMHCCEVQFSQNLTESRTFADAAAFRDYVTQYDGLQP